jgi:hypothetical protein
MGTTPSSGCIPGPCEPLAILGIPVQLCKSSSECWAGQICGIPSNSLLASVLQQMGDKACTAPPDAGMIPVYDASRD